MSDNIKHDGPKILRVNDLLVQLGWSRATLHRRCQTGEFPRPVKTGGQSIGWHASEVQAWIDGLERVNYDRPQS